MPPRAPKTRPPIKHRVELMSLDEILPAKRNPKKHAEDEVGHRPLHDPEAAILREAWKTAWPIRKPLEEKRDAKRAPAYKEPT